MNHRDRRTRRASIGVESLEGRTVLSTAATGMMAPVTADLLRGINYLFVQGSAHGTASRVVGNPDIGTTVMLHGSGNTTNLNSVKVSGSLHGTGFIASGRVEGDITLSNKKGTVTLHLQGPSVRGFTAPASGTYQFSVQKGTGAFAHDIGFGTVDVVLTSKSFRLTFHGRPNTF